MTATVTMGGTNHAKALADVFSKEGLERLLGSLLPHIGVPHERFLFHVWLHKKVFMVPGWSYDGSWSLETSSGVELLCKQEVACVSKRTWVACVLILVCVFLQSFRVPLEIQSDWLNLTMIRDELSDPHAAWPTLRHHLNPSMDYCL
eukprot:2488694-Amphidinium_carterae.1